MRWIRKFQKKIFLKNKILTPKYFCYSYDLSYKDLLFKIKKKLNFPVVIKPIDEGSSVDVFICSKRNILNNLKKLKKYNEIIIEEYIGGREIQAAIISSKNWSN